MQLRNINKDTKASLYTSKSLNIHLHKFVSTEIKFYKGITSLIYIALNRGVKLAQHSQDVAVHHEMFATTHPRELAQGTTRDVPCRELVPIIYIKGKIKSYD